MVKHFNIIMAGVISGIVALFTSWLGVSGTVIGSVLSSFLYQLLSTYYDEKTKDIDFSKVNNRRYRKDNSINQNNVNSSIMKHKIAFIFPVVVIFLVECLFCLSDMNYTVSQVFYLLEAVTDQNLFRVMGIALVVVSIYPLLKPKIIEQKNCIMLLVAGILLFLRGITDIHPILIDIYNLVLYRFDLILGIIICIILLYVIISVLVKTPKIPNIKETFNIPTGGAKKIDTNFDSPIESFEDKFDINQNINDNYIDDFDNIPNNNQNEIYIEDYDEPLPIYEEDYIYVNDPNNPNRTIKKKILKKVNTGYKKPKYK